MKIISKIFKTTCKIDSYTFEYKDLIVLSHQRTNYKEITFELQVPDCEKASICVKVKCGNKSSCEDNPCGGKKFFSEGYENFEYHWNPPCSYLNCKCPLCYNLDELGSCLDNCGCNQIPDPLNGCVCVQSCDCDHPCPPGYVCENGICVPCYGVVIDNQCYPLCDSCEDSDCSNYSNSDCQSYTPINQCVCVPECDCGQWNFETHSCCDEISPIFNVITGTCETCPEGTIYDCLLDGCFPICDCINPICNIPNHPNNQSGSGNCNQVNNPNYPNTCICIPCNYNCDNCGNECGCNDEEICVPCQSVSCNEHEDCPFPDCVCDPVTHTCIPNPCLQDDCSEGSGGCDNPNNYPGGCGCLENGCIPCSLSTCENNEDCPGYPDCICIDGTCVENPCPTSNCIEAGNCTGTNYDTDCGCDENQNCVLCESVPCTFIDNNCPLGCGCINGEICNSIIPCNCELNDCTDQGSSCVNTEDWGCICLTCDQLQNDLTIQEDENFDFLIIYDHCSITPEGDLLLTFKVNIPGLVGDWSVDLAGLDPGSGGFSTILATGTSTVTYLVPVNDDGYLSSYGFWIRFVSNGFGRVLQFEIKKTNDDGEYLPFTCSDILNANFYRAENGFGGFGCVTKYIAVSNIGVTYNNYNWELINGVFPDCAEFIYTSDSSIAYILNKRCSLPDECGYNPDCVEASIKVTALLYNFDPDCEVTSEKLLSECCGCYNCSESEPFECVISLNNQIDNVYAVSYTFDTGGILLSCQPSLNLQVPDDPNIYGGNPPKEGYCDQTYVVPTPHCGWLYTEGINPIFHNGSTFQFEVTGLDPAGNNPKVCLNVTTAAGDCPLCCCYEVEVCNYNCDELDVQYEVVAGSVLQTLEVLYQGLPATNFTATLTNINPLPGTISSYTITENLIPLQTENPDGSLSTGLPLSQGTWILNVTSIIINDCVGFFDCNTESSFEIKVGPYECCEEISFSGNFEEVTFNIQVPTNNTEEVKGYIDVYTYWQIDNFQILDCNGNIIASTPYIGTHTEKPLQQFSIEDHPGLDGHTIGYDTQKGFWTNCESSEFIYVSDNSTTTTGNSSIPSDFTLTASVQTGTGRLCYIVPINNTCNYFTVKAIGLYKGTAWKLNAPCPGTECNCTCKPPMLEIICNEDCVSISEVVNLDPNSITCTNTTTIETNCPGLLICKPVGNVWYPSFGTLEDFNTTYVQSGIPYTERIEIGDDCILFTGGKNVIFGPLQTLVGLEQFIDSTGSIIEIANNTFVSTTGFTDIELPGLIKCGDSCFKTLTVLTNLYLPNLIQIGSTLGGNNIFGNIGTALVPPTSTNVVLNNSHIGNPLNELDITNLLNPAVNNVTVSYVPTPTYITTQSFTSTTTFDGNCPDVAIKGVVGKNVETLVWELLELTYNDVPVSPSLYSNYVVFDNSCIPNPGTNQSLSICLQTGELINPIIPPNQNKCTDCSKANYDLFENCEDLDCNCLFNNITSDFKTTIQNFINSNNLTIDIHYCVLPDNYLLDNTINPASYNGTFQSSLLTYDEFVLDIENSFSDLKIMLECLFPSKEFNFVRDLVTTHDEFLSSSVFKIAVVLSQSQTMSTNNNGLTISIKKSNNQWCADTYTGSGFSVERGCLHELLHILGLFHKSSCLNYDVIMKPTLLTSDRINNILDFKYELKCLKQTLI